MIVFGVAVVAATSTAIAARAHDNAAAAALAIVQRHCGACHAAEPTHPAMKETPKGVVLGTIADLKKHARTIAEQTVQGKAMPLGNETDMTDAERAMLGRWLKAVQ